MEKFALLDRWRKEFYFPVMSGGSSDFILSFSSANLLKILPCLNKCFGLTLIVKRTKHNVLFH